MSNEFRYEICQYSNLGLKITQTAWYSWKIPVHT